MPFTLKIDIKKTENALPHSYLWFNKKKKRHCRSLQGRKQWGSLAFFVLTLQKACNILFFFFLLKVFRDVKKHCIGDSYERSLLEEKMLLLY